MSRCKLANVCPFFTGKLGNLNGLYTIYMRKFCLGDCYNCARYMVAEKVGSERVPANLYPTQKVQARMILAGQTNKKKQIAWDE